MSADCLSFRLERKDLRGLGCPLFWSLTMGWVFTPYWFLFQPERINPELNQKGYNVKSDVWSLGITMVTPGWGWVQLWLIGWSQGGAVPNQ